jgi:hypothetical protein
MNSPSFDEFWAVYPRKVGKGIARKAWEKVTKTVDPAVVMAGAMRYRDDPTRKANDRSFTAHPTTWLNREGWEDELDSPQRPTSIVYLEDRYEDTRPACCREQTFKQWYDAFPHWFEAHATEDERQKAREYLPRLVGSLLDTRESA